jgi:hypothetical protein
MPPAGADDDRMDQRAQPQGLQRHRRVRGGQPLAQLRIGQRHHHQHAERGHQQPEAQAGHGTDHACQQTEEADARPGDAPVEQRHGQRDHGDGDDDHQGHQVFHARGTGTHGRGCQRAQRTEGQHQRPTGPGRHVAGNEQEHQRGQQCHGCRGAEKVARDEVPNRALRLGVFNRRGG